MNWWYAQALEGHNTGRVSRLIEKICQPHNCHGLPLKGRLIFCLGLPDCLFPYFYFRFACLSNIINELFPFRYPTNWATLNFGGMLTNMWIWSGQASASIISTPLNSHSFLSIIPISILIFPYITCRLYFGANTIWYLQFHFVCAKLWLSVLDDLLCVDAVGKPASILPKEVPFFYS